MSGASLVLALKKLKKSAIAKTIRKRIRGFSSFCRKPAKEIFKELCFCLLTANYNAERAIALQNALDDKFLFLPASRLAAELRRHGYRFPNTRAHYIAEARCHIPSLKKLFGFGGGKAAREWLVKNVKGLGCKEASHFLRNIGFGDVAIVDFHIADLLARNGVIKKPRRLTKKRYLAIERKLEALAAKTGLSLAELDLFLWYIETQKVLK